MRKELSTISVFSMAVSFAAAVVLCMQTVHLKSPIPWELSGLTLWALEIGFFGIAVLVWRRSASLSGWLLGVGALAAVRYALTAACAYGAAGLQTGPPLAQAAAQMQQLVPRVAASFFSLMVFYPLRTLLPDRLGLPRPRKAEPSAPSHNLVVDDGSIWLMRGDQSVRVQRREEEVVAPQPQVVTIASPNQITGVVELPVEVFLTQIAPSCLAPATARPAESVSVPLSLLLHQLKEARLVLSMEEVARCLPAGVLVRKEAMRPEDQTAVVCLPLEEVVPRLPAEALELPAPSPPAWAELPDPESVVFATV